MRNLVVLTSILVASTGALAQINRCVGPDGRLQYTDAPCPASTKSAGALAAPAASERPDPRFEAQDLAARRQRLELERERVQLERERTTLERDRVQAARETALPAGAGAVIPRQTGVDSYACDVARRNLGVGINEESKMRSQREYELACFGDRAADIESKRAGRPQVNIRVTPVQRTTTCQQLGYTVVCN